MPNCPRGSSSPCSSTLLTGLEVPSGGRPAQLGILCQNVGTAAAVADAVLRGRPLISRVVTLTGRALAAPRNLEVLIGTPMADLIAQCGGYREPPRRLVCGGPMMGFTLPSLAVPVTKATNCLLALGAAEVPDPRPPRPCIRCGRCAEVCPVRLLPQQLYWHARAKDWVRAQDYRLFDCIECGCCSAVCPSEIPLVAYYRFAKDEVRERALERLQAEQARAHHAARQARLARREQRPAQQRPVPPGGARAAEASAPAVNDDAAAVKRALIAAAIQRAAARKAAAGVPPDEGVRQ